MSSSDDDDEQPFFCQICLDDCPLRERASKSTCEQHSFCRKCERGHVESKLKANVYPVHCASPGCSLQYSLEALQQLTEGTLLTGVLSKLHEEAQIPPEQRMYCPNKACSQALRRTEEDKASFHPGTCPSCEDRFCYRCKAAWHGSEPCAAEDADEVAFQEVVRRKQWRRCPKCGRTIERTEGCNHVTCPCSYQMCYLCAQPWGDDPSRNRCGCALRGSERVRPASPQPATLLTAALRRLSLAASRPRGGPPQGGYKTRLCRNHPGCPYGSRCHFAHGEGELREGGLQAISARPAAYKTRLCIHYPGCRHGSSCRFAHGEGELRGGGLRASSARPAGYKTRLCNNYPDCRYGSSCHFAHGAGELRGRAYDDVDSYDDISSSAFSFD